MQGRGLKLAQDINIRPSVAVAPYAGAWIETTQVNGIGIVTASPLMQGRGLKRLEIAEIYEKYAGRPLCRGVD